MADELLASQLTVPVGDAPPSISVFKFNDLNANGIPDANEPGIGNVTLFIDSNNNGRLDTGEATAVTNSQGRAFFSGLRQGTYVVREVVPTGFRSTTANPLIVTLGTTDANVVFGNTQLQGGTIIGCKYLDSNNNGYRDGTEAGIGGQTIFIDSNGNGRLDPGEASTITDRFGNYRFDNLQPGTYAIREVPIAGFTQSTPLLNVNLLANDVWACADIGNAPSYTIRVRKFNDTNRNGVQDAGETPLVNVPFILDINRNGRQDAGEPFATSNQNGDVTFTGLPAGSYSLLEIFPGGFGNDNFPISTTPNPIEVTAPGTYAQAAALPSGLTVATYGTFPPAPAVSPITFIPNSTSGGQTSSTPVGNARPNIAIFKYNDANGNGIQDPGEAPIPGTQFFIDVNNNGQIDSGEPTVTTDVNGNAAFTRLLPGNYTVREVVPSGFSPSTPNPVNITIGGQDARIVFGNAPLGQITGCKFSDLNNNGYKDGNERGIQGVTVYIDANGNGVLDQGERTSVTDQFGLWSFNNLAAGNYSIREVTPPGSFQTTPPLNVLLGPGQKFDCATIGNGQFYDLTVKKFEDINRNGVQDSGEPVIPNTPFILDFNRNQRQDPGEPLVLTDANGLAVFRNLPPGTYSVFELQPAGLQIGTTPNPFTAVVPGPNTQPASNPPTPTSTTTGTTSTTTGTTSTTTGTTSTTTTRTGSDITTSGGDITAQSVDSLLLAGVSTQVTPVSDLSLGSSSLTAQQLLQDPNFNNLLLGVNQSSLFPA
ncbi:MAG: MSCRAMM family protein [Actinomycetota bacterium]